MIHILQGVLSPQQVAKVHAQLKQAEFADGALTAQGLAKAVKHNQQLTARQAPQLIGSLTQHIVQHPAIKVNRPGN